MATPTQVLGHGSQPAHDEDMADVERTGAQRQRVQSPPPGGDDVPGVSTPIHDYISVDAAFLNPARQQLKVKTEAAAGMVKEALQRLLKARQTLQHMQQKEGCPSSLVVKDVTWRFAQEILGQHSDDFILLDQQTKQLQEQRVNILIRCQTTAVQEAADALAAAKTAATAELESAMTASVPASLLQYRAVQVLFCEMRAWLTMRIHELEQQHTAQLASEQQRQERRAAQADARAAQQGPVNLEEQVRQAAAATTRDLQRQVTGLQQQLNQLRAAPQGRPAPRQQQQQQQRQQARPAPRQQQQQQQQARPAPRQQQQGRGRPQGQQRQQPPPRAGSARPAPRQQQQGRQAAPAVPGNRAAGDAGGAWQVPRYLQRRQRQQAQQQQQQRPAAQQQQRRRQRDDAQPFGRGHQ